MESGFESDIADCNSAFKAAEEFCARTEKDIDRKKIKRQTTLQF